MPSLNLDSSFVSTAVDTYQNPAKAASQYLSNMMGQYGLKAYSIIAVIKNDSVGATGTTAATLPTSTGQAQKTAPTQTEILSNGSISTAQVHQERTVTRNPVEDGFFITDHTFRVPTDITFHYVIERKYASAIAQAKALVYDTSVYMLVRYENQTMPGVYIVNTVQIVKDEEGLDVIEVDVNVSEFITVSASTQTLSQNDVKNTGSSSTVESGTRQSAVYPLSTATSLAIQAK